MSVQEIFGKFAAEIDGEVKLFDTLTEAETAVAVFKNGAKHIAIAEQYTKAKGLQGKNAQGKINVITDFLAYVDTLNGDESPEAAAEEDTSEEEIEF